MPRSMNMTEANQERLASYKKNSRFIKGVSFLGTLDGNCCVVCAALDGTQWDLDGNPLSGHTIEFQVPPMHDGCRCILSPILKNTLGLDFGPDTRASSQGPITGDTSFDAFLKRQPPEFARDLLGKECAALFHRGTLRVRDLINDDASPRTSDEIAFYITNRDAKE